MDYIPRRELHFEGPKNLRTWLAETEQGRQMIRDLLEASCRECPLRTTQLLAKSQEEEVSDYEQRVEEIKARKYQWKCRHCGHLNQPPPKITDFMALLYCEECRQWRLGRTEAEEKARNLGEQTGCRLASELEREK